MSESVRLSDKDLIKGSDVIIILRKKRENSTIKTMKTEIGALLKKSGLL
jgi:RNase P protein component